MTGGKGTAISTTEQSKVELALKAHLPYGKMAPFVAILIPDTFAVGSFTKANPYILPG